MQFTKLFKPLRTSFTYLYVNHYTTTAADAVCCDCECALVSPPEQEAGGGGGGGRGTAEPVAVASVRVASGPGVVVSQPGVLHLPSAAVCVGILPGLGAYSGSSDSESSSDSEGSVDGMNPPIKRDRLFR